MGQNIYMLPSDMNLKIKTGTIGYKNKIPISDGKFSPGKNNEVNAPTMKSHAQTATDSNDLLVHTPTITHKNQEPLPSGVPLGPKTITHSDEKIALVLALASGFAIWNVLLKFNKMYASYGSPAEVFIIITSTTYQLV